MTFAAAVLESECQEPQTSEPVADPVVLAFVRERSGQSPDQIRCSGTAR